jgi:hypothetical protein
MATSWWNRFFTSQSRSAARRRPARARLGVEQLETRLVPTAAARLVNGLLQIAGDGSGNTITLAHTPFQKTLVITNNQFQEFNDNDINTIQIVSFDPVSGKGNDIVNVNGTVIFTSVGVNGTVHVGNGVLGTIQALLLIGPAGTAGSLALTLDDSNDASPFISKQTIDTVTSPGGNSGRLTGFNLLNTPIMWQYNANTTVNLDFGPSTSMVNVQGTGVPTNIFSPATVNIGSGSSFGTSTINGIQGSVTVNGPGSGTTVNVNDQSNPFDFNRTYTLTANGMTRTAFPSPVAPITFNNVPNRAFNLSGEVDVQATPAGTSTNFNTNRVILAQGFLPIQGTVSIVNPSSSPAVFVQINDSSDATPQNVIISSSRVTSQSALFAPINLTAASVRTLTIDGPTSQTSSTYTITGTPCSRSLNLLTGGPDIVNVFATAAGTTTTIEGSFGGNGTFNVGSTLDPSSTLDPILGVVQVFSGHATDTLNINDQGSTTGHIYNVTQGTFNSTYTRSAPGTPLVVTIVFSNILNLQRHDGPLLGTPTQAAELSFPSTIAAGHFATLSGRLVGTGELSLSVVWGDGSPVAHRTPDLRPFRLKHKYAQPGTYRVRAVWTDSSGQSGFRQLTITVTPAGDDDDQGGGGAGGSGGGGGGGGGSGSSFRLPGAADDAVDNLAGSLVRAAQGSRAENAAVLAFFDAAGEPFDQQIGPMQSPEQLARAGAGLTEAGASDPWAGSKELDLFFAGLSDLLPECNARREVVIG